MSAAKKPHRNKFAPRQVVFGAMNIGYVRLVRREVLTFHTESGEPVKMARWIYDQPHSIYKGRDWAWEELLRPLNSVEIRSTR